ncbi:hypothetical protein HK101_008102 [Irineochytrium annulatum]|nr:hypothetical protein HK101_008102 [Irineochytrium annulatum]
MSYEPDAITTRGVTLSFLLAFRDALKKSSSAAYGLSTDAVYRAHLRLPGGLSAVDFLTAAGAGGVVAEAGWFVIHARAAPFLDFADALETFFARRGDDPARTVVWVDGMSYPQSEVEMVRTATFFLEALPGAIGAIGRSVIVLDDWDAPMAVSRAMTLTMHKWCCLEVDASDKVELAMPSARWAAYNNFILTSESPLVHFQRTWNMFAADIPRELRPFVTIDHNPSAKLLRHPLGELKRLVASSANDDVLCARLSMALGHARVPNRWYSLLRKDEAAAAFADAEARRSRVLGPCHTDSILSLLALARLKPSSEIINDLLGRVRKGTAVDVRVKLDVLWFAATCLQRAEKPTERPDGGRPAVMGGQKKARSKCELLYLQYLTLARTLPRPAADERIRCLETLADYYDAKGRGVDALSMLEELFPLYWARREGEVAVGTARGKTPTAKGRPQKRSEDGKTTSEVSIFDRVYTVVELYELAGRNEDAVRFLEKAAKVLEGEPRGGCLSMFAAAKAKERDGFQEDVTAFAKKAGPINTVTDDERFSGPNDNARSQPKIFNAAYVKPMTSKSGLSLLDEAELSGATSSVSEATWFVSHAWKYEFTDVVVALSDFFEGLNADPATTFIWFDLFCNSQHGTGERPFEWWTTTFWSAITKMQNVVMILQPWDRPVTLQRAWCVFEIYSCHETGSTFHIAMCKDARRSFESTVLSRPADIRNILRGSSVSQCEAFKPSDLESILCVVRNGPGVEKLDALVRGVMDVWLHRNILRPLTVAWRLEVDAMSSRMTAVGVLGGMYAEELASEAPTDVEVLSLAVDKFSSIIGTHDISTQWLLELIVKAYGPKRANEADVYRRRLLESLRRGVQADRHAIKYLLSMGLSSKQQAHIDECVETFKAMVLAARARAADLENGPTQSVTPTHLVSSLTLHPSESRPLDLPDQIYYATVLAKNLGDLLQALNRLDGARQELAEAFEFVHAYRTQLQQRGTLLEIQQEEVFLVGKLAELYSSSGVEHQASLDDLAVKWVDFVGGSLAPEALQVTYQGQGEGEEGSPAHLQSEKMSSGDPPGSTSGGGGGDAPRPASIKVYVGRLPPNAQKRDLEELFGKYGRILSVEIKQGGFAFVEFDEVRDAEDAIKGLNGYPFEGDRLMVEFSRRAANAPGHHGGSGPGGSSTCFVCGSQGHWARECPENAEQGLDVRSGKCFRCGQPGHLARFCGGDSRDRYDRGGYDRRSRDYDRGYDSRYDSRDYDRYGRGSPMRGGGGGGRSPMRRGGGYDDRGYGPPPRHYDDYGRGGHGGGAGDPYGGGGGPRDPYREEYPPPSAHGYTSSGPPGPAAYGGGKVSDAAR